MNYTRDFIYENNEYTLKGTARHYLNNEIVFVGRINQFYCHSVDELSLKKFLGKDSQNILQQIDVKHNAIYKRKDEKIFVIGPSLNVNTKEFEVLANSFSEEQIILPIHIFNNEQVSSDLFVLDEYLNVSKISMSQMLHNERFSKKEQHERNGISITNIFVQNMLVVEE